MSSRVIRRTPPALISAFFFASLLASFLTSFLACPRSAEAWTETYIESAGALIDATGEGDARVTLHVDLRIRGGWLTGLELTGLDPELRLAEGARAVLIGEDGRRYFPSVEISGGGVVWLRFQRSNAPRRGRYRAELHYESPLASPRVIDGRRALEYTLPAFLDDLEGAELRFIAPNEASLPRDFDPRSIIRHQVEERGSDKIFTFRRINLPRERSFTVRLDLPSERPPLEIVEGRSFGSISDGFTTAHRLPSAGEIALPLLMAAWAIAARAAYRRAAVRRGAKPKSVPGIQHPLAHAALSTLLALLAIILFPRAELAAFSALALLLALSLERTPTLLSPPAPGEFSMVSAKHLREAHAAVRALRFEPIRFLDPLSPIGALITLSAIAAIVALELSSGQPIRKLSSFTPYHGLFLFAALAFSFGRGRLPRLPEQRLIDLKREAGRLFLPFDSPHPLALALAVHRDGSGALQDARLRVYTQERPNGLLRLDIATADLPGAGGFTAIEVLILVSRAGSIAERIIAERFPDVPYQDAPGSRRARVLPLGATPEPLIEAIASAARADENRAPIRARELSMRSGALGGH